MIPIIYAKSKFKIGDKVVVATGKRGIFERTFCRIYETVVIESIKNDYDGTEYLCSKEGSNTTTTTEKSFLLADAFSYREDELLSMEEYQRTLCNAV